MLSLVVPVAVLYYLLRYVLRPMDPANGIVRSWVFLVLLLVTVTGFCLAAAVFALLRQFNGFPRTWPFLLMFLPAATTTLAGIFRRVGELRYSPGFRTEDQRIRRRTRFGPGGVRHGITLVQAPFVVPALGALWLVGVACVLLLEYAARSENAGVLVLGLTVVSLGVFVLAAWWSHRFYSYLTGERLVDRFINLLVTLSTRAESPAPAWTHHVLVGFGVLLVLVPLGAASLMESFWGYPAAWLLGIAVFLGLRDSLWRRLTRVQLRRELELDDLAARHRAGSVRLAGHAAGWLLLILGGAVIAGGALRGICSFWVGDQPVGLLPALGLWGWLALTLICAWHRAASESTPNRLVRLTAGIDRVFRFINPLNLVLTRPTLPATPLTVPLLEARRQADAVLPDHDAKDAWLVSIVSGREGVGGRDARSDCWTFNYFTPGGRYELSIPVGRSGVEPVGTFPASQPVFAPVPDAALDAANLVCGLAAVAGRVGPDKELLLRVQLPDRPHFLSREPDSHPDRFRWAVWFRAGTPGERRFLVDTLDAAVNEVRLR